MNIFWMGWFAFMALDNNDVQADSLTSSNILSQSAPTSSPERWIWGCDWLNRDEDDDDPPIPDPTGPCGGLTVCNATHENLTSIISQSQQTECKYDLYGDRLTVTCEYCSGCGAFEGKDACIESSSTSYVFDIGSDSYSYSQSKRNVTSSGADSAANNVFEVRSFDCLFMIIEGEGLSNPLSFCDDAEHQESDLEINGIPCDSVRKTENFCKIYDCRNINSEYYWTCNDFDQIRIDPSHPLHGLLTFKSYCPKR